MEASLDIYRPKSGVSTLGEHMRRRSCIMDIISIEDIVVLLTVTGVASAFTRVTNKMLALLTRPEEQVESIFYNKHRDSIIIASGFSGDDYVQKTFREISVGLLRRKHNTGSSIFGSKKVLWPGCIEFDAVNSKALMKRDGSFEIYDLKDYSFMYKIPDMDVLRVVCRPHILLIVRQERDLLSFVTRCIDTGNKLYSINHPIDGNIDSWEVIDHKLLLKERNKYLQIIDVKNSEKLEVAIGPFTCHALDNIHRFITFQDSGASELRSLCGKVWKQLETALWISETAECMICRTSDDDTLIYVSTPKDSYKALITVCSTRAGAIIKQVEPYSEVTSLAYNEDLGEIYTGTKRGIVHIYSC